ncbi:hypothetical protein [Streptomyces sp. NPDC002467]|uniref:hypothetical protein n=1 Tax=Streptomyces sp. NPDC002467 TaxID=3364647 RepID=UPI0036760AB9
MGISRRTVERYAQLPDRLTAADADADAVVAVGEVWGQWGHLMHDFWTTLYQAIED